MELLAEALLTLAERHGCTQIVDVGAGRGELLGALRQSNGARMGAAAMTQRARWA